MDKKEPEKNSGGRKKKYTKGFYVIFALCMFAMVGAAWSAYSSVSEYMEPSVIETVPDSTEEVTEAETEAETQPQTQPQTQPETAPVANQLESTLPTDGEDESEAEANENSYFYPVGNVVLKAYSGSTPVKSETFGDYRTHLGTDYKTEKGASIHSMTTGVVQSIKTDEIMGGVVVIENSDGSIATYCGVEPSEGIKIGAHLSAGDVFGTVGDIVGEEKDGPHLHLELSADGKNVDPNEYLNNHGAI